MTDEELRALQREFCDHLKPLGTVKVDRQWYDGEKVDAPNNCKGKSILLFAPVKFERVIDRRGSLNLLQCAAAGRRWFAWVDNSKIEWVNPLPPPKPIAQPADADENAPGAELEVADAGA